MEHPEQTVETLPEGAFHLAVVMIGERSEPITDGVIETDKGQKKLINLNSGAIYDSNTKVPFFQKEETGEVMLAGTKYPKAAN